MCLAKKSQHKRKFYGDQFKILLSTNNEISIGYNNNKLNFNAKVIIVVYSSKQFVI